MNSSRQPKLKISLRVAAVISLFAWVLASSLCLSESLFSHWSDGAGHDALRGHQSDWHHDTASTEGPSGHSHDSNNGEEGGSCCSSLNALPHTGSSALLPKGDFGQLAPLHFALLTPVLTFVQPEVSPPRQTKSRDWVFTPEVYLGPAFRSHAPPLFA